MNFIYTNAENTQISGELNPGESLGNITNPIDATSPLVFSIGMAPGNREYDELQKLIAAKKVTVAAYSTPAPAVPDSPTLGDWRVGLVLWTRQDAGKTVTRLSDVTAAVKALVEAGNPLGAIAAERLEYSNNVKRSELLALKDAFGFTSAEVDESLQRANRVALGDLTGVWPPAA